MDKFEDPLLGLLKSLMDGGADFVEACNKLESEVFDEAAFSAEVFSGLMGVIQDGRLHRMNDSVFFLKIFEFNGDLLNEGQRGAFFDALKLTFGRFNDEASSVLGVELLVESGGGPKAFDFLKSVAKEAATSKARCLAAHGFSWLAKKTDDNHLRSLCLTELNGIAACEDDTASAEAKVELRRRAEDAT